MTCRLNKANSILFETGARSAAYKQYVSDAATHFK